MFVSKFTSRFFSRFPKKIKKVLICPDKFKFSLSATQVSHIIRDSLPPHIKTTIITLADGGEGSLDTISSQIKGQWVTCKVGDPLLRPIQAKYYETGQKEAFIEMARASGLALVEQGQRNPLKTSTVGTGQLILNSLERGNKKVNLLIGGSATNDGGIGCASALGFSFFNSQRQLLNPIGQNLLQLDHFQHPGQKMREMIESAEITVYSDVLNPLTGNNGASYVYGPQKGADRSAIKLLDEGLENINRIFIEKYGVDANDVPGSGGAGGLGAGCYFFLKAKLLRGIDLIFKVTEFQRHLQEADLVITGEGKFDGQTLEGKVVKGVIERGLAKGKPVVVLSAIVESKEGFSWREDEVRVMEILREEEKTVVDPEVTRLRISEAVTEVMRQD